MDKMAATMEPPLSGSSSSSKHKGAAAARGGQQRHGSSGGGHGEEAEGGGGSRAASSATLTGGNFEGVTLVLDASQGTEAAAQRCGSLGCGWPDGEAALKVEEGRGGAVWAGALLCQMHPRHVPLCPVQQRTHTNARTPLESCVQPQGESAVDAVAQVR